MDLVLLAARAIIALVFAAAGVAKLLDRAGTRRGIADFGVPVALVNPLGFVLPLAELAVAVALIPSVSAWWGAVGAVALLILFMAGIGFNLARGNTPDCHCFGQLHSEPIGSVTLVRNGLLTVGALVIVAQGPSHPGRGPLDWLGSLSVAGRAGVVVGVLAVALLWFLFHLLRENRRLLTRIESLGAAGPVPEPAGNESQQAHPGTPPESSTPASALPDTNGQPGTVVHTQAPGRLVRQVKMTLKIGAPAPAVSFLDMYGRTHSLADYRGWDTLVLFWDSNSRDCKQILPGLRGFEARPPRSVPKLLIVVQGSANGNQTVNLRSPVVIDRDGSVARAFGVSVSPTAILVDAHGNVGSDLAAGPDRVLALASGRRDLMAHSRGRVRWAGLEFDVNRDVMPPSLETESVAEKAVELARERGARVVADLGTGSGNVATFLARELPEARIYAVDVSTEALAVARRNLERHRISGRVELLQGSLLEPLPERPDLIVADLPYMSDEIMPKLGDRLRFEPRIGLYGGPTGLELYAQLFRQMVERNWVVPLVLEVMPPVSKGMRNLLEATFVSGRVEILPDFEGWHRVAVFVPQGVAGQWAAASRLRARPNDRAGAALARAEG